MTERCSVEIRTAPNPSGKSLDYLEDHFIHGLPITSREWFIEETSYPINELSNLAATGCLFVGRYGHSDDWCAHKVCGFDGSLWTWPVAHGLNAEPNKYVVSVDDTGRVTDDEQQGLGDFVERYERAKSIVDTPASPPSMTLRDWLGRLGLKLELNIELPSTGPVYSAWISDLRFNEQKMIGRSAKSMDAAVAALVATISGIRMVHNFSGLSLLVPELTHEPGDFK